MKKLIQVIINTVSVLSVVGVISNCNVRKTSSDAIIFSNHPFSIYDNNMTQSIYEIFKATFSEQTIVDNSTQVTNQDSFWKMMVDYHIKNKSKYFFGLNHNFFASIPNLTKEFDKAIATGIKFVTFDYDTPVVEDSISNLINIKFDIESMARELGYKTATYLLNNSTNLNLVANKIQISAINYDDQVALKLVNGFKLGVLNAQKEKKSANEINFIEWPNKIVPTASLFSQNNAKNIYYSSKQLLTKNKVSLIFDPLSLYSDDLLRAFSENSFLDGTKKNYIASIDTIDRQKYNVKGNDYLLGTINRDFKKVMAAIENASISSDLLTSWAFNSDVIKN